MHTGNSFDEGFKRFVRTGIVLTVAATVSINVALEVGEITDEVVVTTMSVSTRKPGSETCTLTCRNVSVFGMSS